MFLEVFDVGVLDAEADVDRRQEGNPPWAIYLTRGQLGDELFGVSERGLDADAGVDRVEDSAKHVRINDVTRDHLGSLLRELHVMLQVAFELVELLGFVRVKHESLKEAELEEVFVIVAYAVRSLDGQRVVLEIEVEDVAVLLASLDDTVDLGSSERRFELIGVSPLQWQHNPEVDPVDTFLLFDIVLLVERLRRLHPLLVVDTVEEVDAQRHSALDGLDLFADVDSDLMLLELGDGRVVNVADDSSQAADAARKFEDALAREAVLLHTTEVPSAELKIVDSAVAVDVNCL